MSRPEFGSILLTGLLALAAACGTGGLEYWLYPEPRLAPGEDAVVATYESNLLLLLDQEDAASRCWGDRRMATQAYRRTDRMCRLHILPGRHSAVVQTGLNNRLQVRIEFTALPGRVYGVQRSGCSSSTEGIQQNCRFEILEIRGNAGGG